MTGQTISHYHILDKLGQGGMGVVYKAEDTKLKRIVALKFIPREAAGDAELRARFLQEAQAAAALSHPHICTVFEIDEAHGFLALEFIDGETVADRVRRRPLPLAEALDLAIQAAEALHAAHEKGVVHRDIKSANIMVTAKGQAKVMDFGLAQLSDRTRITRKGARLGTPAYMSPEQAAGKTADRRTDIWSLGVVLYEMVAGALPFAGESDTAVARAILNDDPEPLTARRAGLPLELDRVVGKTLAKDPGARYQHADEFAVDLRRVRALLDGRTAGAKRTRLRTVALAAAAALALVAATAAMMWLLLRRTTAPDITPETLTRLTHDAGMTTDPTLSPDGALVAYASDRAGAGNLDLWVQQVGSGEPVQLTKDPFDEREPSFSPDGTRIVFRSSRDGGGIELIPALGGAARRIASEGRSPLFSPDGTSVAYFTGDPNSAVLANASTKLLVVDPDGGSPREIATGFSGVCCPIWTPDGKHLMFLGNRDANLPLNESLDWWVVPLEGGPPAKTGVLNLTRARGLRGPVKNAPEAVLPAAWIPDSSSVIFSAQSGDSTNLWQAEISPETFHAEGDVRRLTAGTGFEWQPSAASSPYGKRRAVFASRSENSDIWSVPIAAGQAKSLGVPQRIIRSAADDFHGSLSADAGKLAFVSSRTGIDQIWIKNLDTGEESGLTSSPTEKYGPLFSPDGSTLIYSRSGTWEIYRLRVSAGGEELVTETPGLATSFTPDGAGLVFHDIPGRVSLLDLASGRRTELLSKPGARLVTTTVAPDGRWLAFRSMSAGNSRIYAAPFRGPAHIDEKDWIAITDGSFEDADCRWSPQSDILYFRSDRDGYTCIWSQRLDPLTKRPTGNPAAVHHEHSASRSITRVEFAQDRIVFEMVERTGNIWMAEWGAH